MSIVPQMRTKQRYKGTKLYIRKLKLMQESKYTRQYTRQGKQRNKANS